ncbi:hypothetical protein Taro_013562 [Colocasia esculenta]|uniref:Major facilitator superfamily (MFS) profile domain-containing protein n=1 Tax=Colocasia esculenta TaxID=4460 RepID=A0A843UMI3_COLES|nr:hypothetical protein [Colocasia esculenta]
MGSLGDESRAQNGAEFSKPSGIRYIEHIHGSPLNFRAQQALVLVITFLSYACYHATRKTASIVKGVLDSSSPHLSRSLPCPLFLLRPRHSSPDDGWAPFDGPDGRALLGEIDVAFLSAYSVGIYFAGHLGDRLDLRVFLAAGMAGTGLFTSLLGAGYWLDVHSFYYYLAVQMLAGLLQSTGWPSVVAVVGRWCGKGKRGLIMGVWNAHTSVGNIAGSLLAAALLKCGWGWSFLVPGLLIAAMGAVVLVFLPVNPVRVDDRERDTETCKQPLTKKAEAAAPLLREAGQATEQVAVGFIEAWRIPGVATFALCLFFSKLVAYTFLYWLPFYLSDIAIDGEYLSDSLAGTLSTLFDVGGVAGGILAGHISDRLNARAITAAGFMYCSIPALFLYRVYGGGSLHWNAALMLVAGAFVNGPYALITTAVSADLGGGASGEGGQPRALATVTAIIDGTGSVGAALGPLLTGYVSARSWNGVFTMLMGAAFVAGLLLTRLVVAEVAAKIGTSRSRGGGSPLVVEA